MDKNIEKGKISVILPVYNTQEYIEESIRSILTQTYDNFELIVINDGSTDKTKDIIFSFNDSRIKIYNFTENKGLVERLNFGLSIANGEFIARMDADDIAVENRFELQINCFRERPNICLCYTDIETIDQNKNKVKNWFRGFDSKYTKIFLLFDNNIPHPTVMLKNHIIKQKRIFYNSLFFPAEDYELWYRLINLCNFEFLDKKLLYYRVHNNNVSIIKQNYQAKIVKKIITYQLSKLGLTPNNVEYFIHRNLFLQKLFPAPDLIEKSQQWVQKLIYANKTTEVYDQSVFNEFITLLLDELKIKFKSYIDNLSVKNKLLFRVKSIVSWESIDENNPIVKKLNGE